MIEEGLNKLKNREILKALNIFKELNKLQPNDGDVLFFLGTMPSQYLFVSTKTRFIKFP